MVDPSIAPIPIPLAINLLNHPISGRSDFRRSILIADNNTIFQKDHQGRSVIKSINLRDNKSMITREKKK